ncbi:hypothetical protein HY947_03015 [Candidatus Gottesmanbacteria bacterium]|nr:hypothetical protein [Candidatus Gottesmanbacteria bacterium]
MFNNRLFLSAVVRAEILFFVLLFLSNYPVFAVSISPLSVDINSPVIGDAFTLTATMSGAVAGSNYFVKCRIGGNTSSLNDGQTFNSQSSKWLDDTGSSGAWVDMPQVAIGVDGYWSGLTRCRIKSSSTDEAKLLFVRACLNTDNSCGTSFQSLNSLPLNPIVPTSTPTPIPTSTPTPTPEPSPTPTRTPTPTSTPSPTSTPTSSTKTPTSMSTKSVPSPSISLKDENDVLADTDEAFIQEKTVIASDGSVLGVTTDSNTSNNTPRIDKMMAVTFGFIAAGLGVFSLASVIYIAKKFSFS